MAKPKPHKYQSGYRVNFEYPPGTRHRKRFSIRQYADPKQAAQDYINSVFQGHSEEWTPLGPVIREYLSWAERTGRKRYSTLRVDRSRLETFAEWASRDTIKSPRDIHVSHIRKFQDFFLSNYPLYKEGLRHLADKDPDEFTRRRFATWDKYRVTLAAFLSWCADRGYVDKNILAGNKEFIVRRQERLHIRFFSPEELAQLYEWTDRQAIPMWSAFYRLLAYTGVRVGEAMHLRWGDIDLSNSGEFEGILRVANHTKNKRIRTIPIHEQLRPYLEAIRPSKPRLQSLAISRDGKTPYYCANRWYRILQKALAELDLPQARLYDLRHTFGASLAQAGVPLPTIKELMGHASISTTMIYVHFAPKHLQGAVKKLPF